VRGPHPPLLTIPIVTSPTCALRRSLALLLLAACADSPPPAAAVTSLAAHPEWARDAVIYEVNVRQFTPEGTFTAFAGHLARLDSLGVDILWLMPVQPIGVAGRKGPLGSYYAVSDYRKANPEFGTEAELRAVIDSAHALGMRVILDWVPNHTANDHTWITEHPDWYVRNADGTISVARDNEGNPTDWTDVSELDYTSDEMRRAMIADMTWWLTEMGIDGFRQDVAGGAPMDFWRQARTALAAAKPDVFMLAESEKPLDHDAFDATYGWEFHHLLNAIAQGKEPVGRIDEYLAKQQRDYPANAFRMYFTSNHDENSWQGTEFERMGDDHKPAFVLAATLVNSFPLLYTGQEAGLNKRLRFFQKDTVSWADQSLAPFYRALFDLKARVPALWNGADGGAQVRLAGDGGDAVYAFTRTKGESGVVVAVNFGDAPVTLNYTGLGAPGRYTDAFTGASVELGATGTLALPAHGYAVLSR